jgi:hypothetical protein
MSDTEQETTLEPVADPDVEPSPDETEPEPEPDEPEPEPDEGEHVPTSPPPPPDTEADVEAKIKKLATASRNYSRRIVEILGDDLDGWLTCELCEAHYPGIRLPVPPDEALAAKLRSILGMPALENYRRDNQYNPCATCDGLGTILTGSKVAAHMTRTCGACKGTGYIDMRTGEAPTLNGTTTPNVHLPEPIPTEEAPDVDPWGTPLGDPDYGRLPHLRAKPPVLPTVAGEA